MHALHDIHGETLGDAYMVADIADLAPGEVRRLLVQDPEALPLPLCLAGSGLRCWPLQQLRAWVLAGKPHGFELWPTDFVPASLAAFHDWAELAKADPHSPFAPDPRAVKAALGGEPACTYPKD